MTRRVLISGSVAFDTIMVFEGLFKDHILADKVHMLNVAFLTPRLKREFGGCAANIAYNLKLLGGDPVVLATIGHDGGVYRDRIAQFGIDTSHLLQL
ncbi:MAG: PfkB family carbohydrate kinase, partial [Quisquiliibacterium sp.]